MIRALLVLLVACADDVSTVVLVSDAALDASPCPVQHTSICNPLTQAGCEAGHQCTWILGGVSSGHIGCAQSGREEIGEACGFVSPAWCGNKQHDDCVKGSVCQAGRCKRICDHQGGLPQCGAATTCVKVADLFQSGDSTVAGVCQRPEASLPTEGVGE